MFFKDQGDRGHSPMDYTDNNDKGEKEGGTDGDHGGEWVYLICLIWMQTGFFPSFPSLITMEYVIILQWN